MERLDWTQKLEPVKTKTLTNTDGRAGGFRDGIDAAAKPRVNSLMQQRLSEHNSARLSFGCSHPDILMSGSAVLASQFVSEARPPEY